MQSCKTVNYVKDSEDDDDDVDSPDSLTNCSALACSNIRLESYDVKRANNINSPINFYTIPSENPNKSVNLNKPKRISLNSGNELSSSQSNLSSPPSNVSDVELDLNILTECLNRLKNRRKSLPILDNKNNSVTTTSASSSPCNTSKKWHLRPRSAIQICPFKLEKHTFKHTLKSRGIVLPSTCSSNDYTLIDKPSQDYNTIKPALINPIEHSVPNSPDPSAPPTSFAITELPIHFPCSQNSEQESLPDLDIILKPNVAESFLRLHPRSNDLPPDNPPTTHNNCAAIIPGLNNPRTFNPSNSVSSPSSKQPDQVKWKSIDPSILLSSPIQADVNTNQSDLLSPSLDSPQVITLLHDDSDGADNGSNSPHRETSSGISKRKYTSGKSGSSSDVSTLRRRYRRKIRGVLPASWLTLDQANQCSKPHRVRKRLSNRSSICEHVKGVAKSTNRSPASTSHNVSLSDLFSQLSTDSSTDDCDLTVSGTSIPYSSTHDEYSTAIARSKDDIELNQDHDTLLGSSPTKNQSILSRNSLSSLKDPNRSNSGPRRHKLRKKRVTHPRLNLSNTKGKIDQYVHNIEIVDKIGKDSKIPKSCVSGFQKIKELFQDNPIDPTQCFLPCYQELDAETLPIVPLKREIYFHESSLIGKGILYDVQFAKSHMFGETKASQPFVLVECDDNKKVKLGTWDDETRESFGDIWTRVSFCLIQDDNSLGKYFISANSMLSKLLLFTLKSLRFSDSLDCLEFGRTLCLHVEPILQNLKCLTKKFTHPNCLMLLDTLTFILLILLPIHSTLHSLFSNEPLTKCLHNLILLTCDLCFTILFHHRGLQEILKFLRQSLSSEASEIGIKDSNSTVSCVVILHNSLIIFQDTISLTFWDMFNRTFPGLDNVSHLSDIEKMWSATLLFLPLLDFDTSGFLIRHNSLPVSHCDNWKLASCFLNRIFSIDHEDTEITSDSLIKYLKCAISKCFYLLQIWNWDKCENILTIIFDYFAQRKFQNLRNEIPLSSQSNFFINHANPNSVELSSSDTAFNQFLKLLTLAFHRFTSIYPRKKVQSLIYRFIPLHSRLYPKENAILQRDIDALQNHHNLISTLYFISPAGCRPKLSVLQNLVDFSLSHFQACRINIRSWALLLRIQLSFHESPDSIYPFIQYFNHIVEQTFSLYKLARHEAERQFKKALDVSNSNRLTISQNSLESLIQSNQSHILSSMLDALIGISQAVQSTNIRMSSLLVNALPLERIFSMFQPTNVRIENLIAETLNVISKYLQDFRSAYGSGQVKPFDNDLSVLSTVDQSISYLISNVFGSDISCSHTLALQIVETWTCLVFTSTSVNLHDWHWFIDSYNPSSLSSLRDTELKRKYGCKFISDILTIHPNVYHNHASFIFGFWFESLAERDSLLKFQHLLTTHLLNASPQHTLLNDSPFTRSSLDGIYCISLDEFRDHRLDLILTILRNMKSSFQDLSNFGHRNILSCRSEYIRLLNCFLCRIKLNFSATHLLLNAPIPNVPGKYSLFVSEIVNFIHQNLPDFVSLDYFSPFINPSSPY